MWTLLLCLRSFQFEKFSLIFIEWKNHTLLLSTSHEKRLKIVFIQISLSIFPGSFFGFSLWLLIFLFSIFFPRISSSAEWKRGNKSNHRRLHSTQTCNEFWIYGSAEMSYCSDLLHYYTIMLIAKRISPPSSLSNLCHSWSEDDATLATTSV